MSKTDTIHMRVEPEIKARADSILSRLGMSTAEAINIFLNQVILNGGLPFEVKVPQYNAETLKAIEDAKNRVNGVTYENIDEMFKDLGI